MSNKKKKIHLAPVENKLQIFTGGYEVIETGSLAVVQDNPIMFKIRGLEYIFEFRDDLVDYSHRFIGESVAGNEKAMKLIFINFNNPLGIGNIEPLEMGTLGNKKLQLMVRVYALTGNDKKRDRTIHYTWLLES